MSDCGPTHPINYQALIDGTGGPYNFVFGAEPGNSAQGGNVPLNTWTHVAGTFGGTTFKAYINGDLVGTGSGTLGATSTADLRIGSSGDCEKFGGLEDDVQIYGRALNAGQIVALAHNHRYDVVSKGR